MWNYRFKRDFSAAAYLIDQLEFAIASIFAGSSTIEQLQYKPSFIFEQITCDWCIRTRYGYLQHQEKYFDYYVKRNEK